MVNISVCPFLPETGVVPQDHQKPSLERSRCAIFSPLARVATTVRLQSSLPQTSGTLKVLTSEHTHLLVATTAYQDRWPEIYPLCRFASVLRIVSRTWSRFVPTFAAKSRPRKRSRNSAIRVGSGECFGRWEYSSGPRITISRAETRDTLGLTQNQPRWT